MQGLVDGADLKNTSPRFKSLTLEHTCAQQLPASLLLRKGKSWWWVVVVGHMGEVETTVEDHTEEGEEDHLKPP